MSARTVAILVAVAVVLGGSVWWSGRRTGPEGRDERRPLIPPADRIERLVLEGDGARLSLARDMGTGVWLEEPDGPGDLDPAAVRRLLESLGEHRIRRTLRGADPDVAGPAAGRLTYRTRDGIEAGWTFGGLPPAGGGRYAVADDGEVVLVDAGVVDRLRHAPDLVRSRRPLAGIDPDRVREFRLEGAGRPVVTLTRDDGGWRIVTPLADRADPVGVRTAIRALVALTVPEVLAGEVGDAVVLEADLTTEDRTDRLRFAGRPDGSVGVGRVGADWHGSIAPASDAPWNRTPGAWRDPRVLLAPASAVAVVIHDSPGARVLRMDVAAGTVANGDGAAVALDVAAARDAIERMLAARTAGFLERDGIARVAGAWTFRDADDRVLAVLEVGPPDRNGLRPARVSDRPGAWFLVEDEALGGPWTLERFAADGTGPS